MPFRNDKLTDTAAPPKRFQLSIRRMLGITTLVAIVLGILTNLPAGNVATILADIGKIVLSIFFLCLPVAIAGLASTFCRMLRAESFPLRVSVMFLLVIISLPSFGASVYCLSLAYRVHSIWELRSYRSMYDYR